MGAWGTGLYSNDIAEDIREDCRDVFSVKTLEEGLRILEEDYLKEIQEDYYDFYWTLVIFGVGCCSFCLIDNSRP